MSREMVDSGIQWFNDIPKEWKIFQIKNIFDIGRGRVISQQELKEDGVYPVYSSQTKNNGILGYIDTYDFDKEQITWTTDGANAGTIFLREGKYNCTNVCGTLSLKKKFKDYNMNYLKYILSHTCFYHKRQDTNGFKIMNNEMARISILIPSLYEQNRIANYLDKKCAKIDEIINDNNKEIELLEEYKTNIVYEEVNKKTSTTIELKIKNIATVERGIFNHRPRNDAEYYDGIYPFIQTGDVNKESKYILNYSQTLSELGKNVSKEFKKGTIAITIAANIGEVAILGFDSYFPDSVIGINSNNNDYLYYVLKSLKRNFLEDSSVSTQMNLNAEKIKNTKFNYEQNINNQIYVVDKLDNICNKIDDVISCRKQIIEKLEEYKKSLIYEVVTGKKEV